MNKRSKQYYECKADYEYDQMIEARRLAHLDGECFAPCDWCKDETADEARKRRHENQECDGPPFCDYCNEEILEADEKQ